MGAATWQAATSGQPTLTGLINQNLTAHASYIAYSGITVPGVTDPASITAPSTSDKLGWSPNAFAQSFTPSGSLTSNVTLAAVYVALQAIGAGSDVFLSIQPDNGSGRPAGITPATAVTDANGNPVYAIIPAEWLATSAPTSITSLAAIPLFYQPSLTPGTTYYIVLTSYSNVVAGVNDAMWGRANGTGGAFSYNGSAWSTSGTAPFAAYLRYTNSGTVVATVEDNGGLMKSYRGGTPITNVYTWAAALPRRRVIHDWDWNVDKLNCHDRSVKHAGNRWRLFR